MRGIVFIQALLAASALVVLGAEILLWETTAWGPHTAILAGMILISLIAAILAVRALDRNRRLEAADRTGLAATVAQAAEAIVITDRDARIRYVNPAFTRMTGYTTEEAAGQNPRFLKSGRQDAAFYRDLWATIGAGQVWRGELVNRRKDGSHYTEEMSITPVRDATGAVTSYIAIKQDVTERRSAESAQRLLAAVVESSEDAILTHTPAGEIVSWNPGAEVLFGYRREEVAGKPVSLLIPPERQAELPGLFEKLNRGEAIPPFESVAIGGDGRRIDVSIALSPLKDKAGRTVGTAAIIRDIRTRKQIEESRLLLASIVDSSSDAIISVTLDGAIVSWNKGAEAIYGFSADERIGRPLSELVPAEQLGESGQILESVRAGHGISGLETIRLPKHGRPVDVSLSASPIRNASGEIAGGSFIARDITERKRIERELHDSEELFRNAFEYAPFGIVLSAPDGRLLLVNTTLCRMLGYSQQELLSMGWEEITHPDDIALSHESVDRLLHERPAYVDFEKRYLHKQGQIVWVRIKVSIMGVSDTPSWRFVTHIEDITERKKSEQAIRAGEDRVRLLLDSTAEAIYGIDLEGNCTFANPACLRILGYGDLQALIGRNMHDLIHHTRRDGSPYVTKECVILRAFEAGEGAHVDDEVLWRADGTSFPAEYWSHPVRKEGHVVGVVVTFLDITERKRTEEALRSSEEQYRLLVASIPDVVWVADDEGNCVFITPNAESIYGYTPAEIYQSGVWFERIHPEDVGKIREAYTLLLTTGQLFSTEYRIRRKDGPWIWLEARAISSYEKDGKRLTAGLSSDVTARKLAAEELRKAKEAAEEGSRAKSRFLANMSHEIRTPMNGVIGMTRLLLDSNLSPDQRRYAELVRDSGEALMALINHILDLSKIEAGKMVLDSADFDLRVMIEGIVDVLALQTRKKGLELTCFVTPETPSLLHGDPGRLRQVMLNLVANAVKFTERGEVAIRVEVARQDCHQATLRFSIADTGIGIRKDRAAALFSPFVQADESTTRKYGGTGLGLAISKQLVEMMGGEIGFESEEGRGSTFWFTAVLQMQPQPSGVAAPPGAGVCSVKTLVVDPGAANRLTVCTLLRSWGCRADDAVDGDAALVLLDDAAQSGDPYRVALLNESLPDVSAQELATRIKSDPRLTSTMLLLMANPTSGNEMASAFAGIVHKPVLGTRLRATLKTLICPQVVTEAAARGTCDTMRPPRRAKDQARILLAEDNPINRAVALGLLGKLGYTASLAASGSEAVGALQAGAFDLVLMDCEMPDLDGYEATRLIRNPATGTLDPKIPIIAVTAGAMPGDREKCLRAGMDDYLSKPIEPEELAQVLYKWLDRREPAVAPAPLTGDAEPAFDEAGLLQRVLGNKSLAERVARGFLEDIPVQLCNLRKHLEEGNAPSASRQAHTLKGAAATVSANALRTVAFEAEQAALAGELGEVAKLLPRLEQQAGRFKDALALAGWL